MATRWLRRLLRGESPMPRRAGAGARRPPAFRPRLEPLEDRLAPATATWNALLINPFAFDGKWSNPNCWVDGHVPQNGDDVVFRSDPFHLVNRTTYIDLINLQVRSITCSDDFDALGNIKLGGGGIHVTNGTFVMPRVQLISSAPTPFVTDAGAVIFNGNDVSGVGGLTKS